MRSLQDTWLLLIFHYSWNDKNRQSCSVFLFFFCFFSLCVGFSSAAFVFVLIIANISLFSKLLSSLQTITLIHLGILWFSFILSSSSISAALSTNQVCSTLFKCTRCADKEHAMLWIVCGLILLLRGGVWKGLLLLFLTCALFLTCVISDFTTRTKYV